MKTTYVGITLGVALACLGGCSSESQTAEPPMANSLAATSIQPATKASPVANGNAAKSGAGGKIEPFRNPFAPPKEPPPPPVVVEPEPEPEPEPVPEIRQPGTLPKIRLLGFINTGEPKVLVSYRDDLEALAIGDKFEDMEVIKIESPDLTMLFEEQEVKFSLFDQGWEHSGRETAGNSNTRTNKRPRSTPASRKTSVSHPSGKSGGGSARTPSGIPGFGPNAGKPPEFQPPTSTGPGSIGGDSTGTPPAGLPGLPGKGNTGGGIGGGNLPPIPGLGIDTADGKQAGILPPLPSGL